MTLRDCLRNILNAKVFAGVPDQLDREKKPGYVPQPEGYETLFSLGNLVVDFVTGEAQLTELDPQTVRAINDFGQKVAERISGVLSDIGEQRSVG